MAIQRLYRFRAKNPVTGKWYVARYRATEEEIKARYADYELLDAEERELGDDPNRDSASHLFGRPPTKP